MRARAACILQRLIPALAGMKTLVIPPNAYPLVLLGLCGLSYGLLIPRLGFYWDDWVFVWIAEKLGDAGLERYFSTNRPYWGLIYRLTTTLMNTSVPWHWQVFGLAWRWLSAVALWLLLRRTWQRQPEAAAWASALFVVYPAFSAQAIAINYGHFFIVLTAFLLSCSLSLRSLAQPGRAWLYTPLALLLAGVNLLAMEYFFLLELLRPLLMWISLADSAPANRLRARKTLRAWLPYLVLFLAVSIWRAFFFPHQTRNYDLTLVETLRDQPLAALFQLAGTISNDLWLTAVEAWLYAFRLPNPAELGARTTLMYGMLVGVAAAFVGLALALLRRQDAPSSQRKTGWQMAAVGAAGLLIAGWPIWLVNLPLAFGFP
ncbi:MAG: hypothetical protein U1B80_01840, partial [Anaerolineaceae bacterium]|nr:hypothetical protein [Anaerolineaceae bacterium]